MENGREIPNEGRELCPQHKGLNFIKSYQKRKIMLLKRTLIDPRTPIQSHHTKEK